MAAHLQGDLPRHLSGVPPDFVRHPAQSIRIFPLVRGTGGLVRSRVRYGRGGRALGCRPKSGGASETTRAQRCAPDKWWGRNVRIAGEPGLQRANYSTLIGPAPAALLPASDASAPQSPVRRASAEAVICPPVLSIPFCQHTAASGRTIAGATALASPRGRAERAQGRRADHAFQQFNEALMSRTLHSIHDRRV